MRQKKQKEKDRKKTDAKQDKLYKIMKSNTKETRIECI